jgi:hypothetical protein
VDTGTRWEQERDMALQYGCRQCLYKPDKNRHHAHITPMNAHLCHPEVSAAAHASSPLRIHMAAI